MVGGARRAVCLSVPVPWDGLNYRPGLVITGPGNVNGVRGACVYRLALAPRRTWPRDQLARRAGPDADVPPSCSACGTGPVAVEISPMLGANVMNDWTYVYSTWWLTEMN